MLCKIPKQDEDLLNQTCSWVHFNEFCLFVPLVISWEAQQTYSGCTGDKLLECVKHNLKMKDFDALTKRQIVHELK